MTTDVNAQFRAQKQAQVGAAQQAVEANRRALADYDAGLTQAALDAKLAQDVADGKIRMVGDGYYEVLEGWDRNEVFRVQRAVRPGELPLILPEHNLEEKDGKASLFTAQPAWHELGWVNNGATTDVDLVIEKGGLDFEIIQRPVRYFDSSGTLRVMEDQFVNERSDTGAGLGVVGKIYKSVQPREAFSWLHELAGTREVLIESAGVLRGGAKTFITVSLPDEVAIDPGGVNVEVRPYLCLLDDHTGNRKLWAILTPWIVICGNTHNFALRDAVTRWGVRHSTNIHEKIDIARETLGLTVQGYGAFKAEEEALLRTDMTLNDFDKFLATIWEPTDAESTKNARTRESKRNEALHELWAFETGRLGRNAFAAEMVLTGYWDNVVKNVTDGKSRVARATSLLEGEHDEKKAVHKQLLELTSK